MMDMFDGDFNSTTSGTAAPESSKTEGIAPMFIKQILESSDESKLWSMHFGMTVCVAIVRSIETSSTKITYLLEDSTGRIEAHCWLEEGNELKTPDIMLNNYAKVFGSARSQGGNKTLMVFKMLPVTDPNEICTHVLEVLNTRYKCEAMDSHDPSVDFSVPDNSGTNNNFGLEGMQLAVFQAIKNFANSEGVGRDKLQQKFLHMKSSELNSILEFLISEGHIYSTFDSNHFLCTE